jgi:hypothetical protein
VTSVSDVSDLPAQVAEVLGVPADHRDWLTGLAAVDPAPAALPDPAELPEIFERLAVPEADRGELLDLRPEIERPEARWLLDRCHHLLSESMGRVGSLDRWPELPGRIGRYFYVYVYLSALAEVRRLHAERGITDDVSWATLADLGQHMAVYRANRGVGGLHSRPWLTLHFRGLIYSLGRLQFNLAQRTGAAGEPFAAGEWVLGVHIPETGPMTPDACDESFRRAPAFFRTHFPEHDWQRAVCSSWLLDPQLADYLPDSSNIVRFGRRFTLFGEPHDGDRAVLEFVFHHEDPDPDLGALPQRTTLERAVVAHLRNGRHWQVRAGYVTL